MMKPRGPERQHFFQASIELCLISPKGAGRLSSSPLTNEGNLPRGRLSAARPGARRRFVTPPWLGASPAGSGDAAGADRPQSPAVNAPQEFSEKEFYLEEFHGRTLGIALPARGLEPAPQLSELLRELAANATRVVLLSPDRALLEKLLGEAPLEPEDA